MLSFGMIPGQSWGGRRYVRGSSEPLRCSELSVVSGVLVAMPRITARLHRRCNEKTNPATAERITTDEEAAKMGLTRAGRHNGRWWARVQGGFLPGAVCKSGKHKGGRLIISRLISCLHLSGSRFGAPRKHRQDAHSSTIGCSWVGPGAAGELGLAGTTR